MSCLHLKFITFYYLSGSVIRIELNQTYLDYYAELDGIRLYGTLTDPFDNSSGNREKTIADTWECNTCQMNHSDCSKQPSTRGRHSNHGRAKVKEDTQSPPVAVAIIDQSQALQDLARLHIQDGIAAAVDTHNGCFDMLPVSRSI